MTPYELKLTQKYIQAVELSCALSKWGKLTGNDLSLDEQILQTLIQQIETANLKFTTQLDLYRDLYEKRKKIAFESTGCLKQLNETIWEDVRAQFKESTLSRDLIKGLYQKIHRLALPDFPPKRRIQVLYKDARLHEDAYDLYGKYLTWLLDLLTTIKFTPILLPLSLHEVKDQIFEFNSLTQQVMIEAESLRNCQLQKQHLFKQLNQVSNSVKGRLLIYKREAKWMTTG